MTKIRNVSPLGELYVPALEITVAPGEVADVSDEAAASLLEQTENWAPVGKTTDASSSAAPDVPVNPEK